MRRREALRSYTLDCAKAAFEEDQKGSLSPGKLADIAVLSRDILSVPAEDILTTEVLFTIVGGRVLYESVKASIYSPGGLLCLSNHMSGPEVTQPKQFGSHRSRLVLTLLNDQVHRKDVSLSKDEWETLVTWVDANAPYHSTYFQYFDSNGKMLSRPIRVQIELDPPFKAGEKTYRIVAQRPSPASLSRGVPSRAVPR